MRKKREILILLTMLLTVALICGCSTKEEQNNEQKVEGVEIEEDTDTYRFVDVLGNEYEAELLDIPLIKQDLTRIEDQDGKKFYLDEDGQLLRNQEITDEEGNMVTVGNSGRRIRAENNSNGS